MSTKFRYTEEHMGYLREITPGRPISEVAAMFNEKFGLNRPFKGIRSKLKKSKIYNGIDARFGPGPRWNKGTKGLTVGNSGSFKIGHISHNKKAVGTETVRRDKRSNTKWKHIKIAEGKWEHLHVHNWVKVNGPIPEGYVLTFLDQDRMNCSVDNLKLITRQENLIMNRDRMYFKGQPELTETATNVAKLIHINRMKQKEEL